MAFVSGDIVKNVVPVVGTVMGYDPQKTNKEPTKNPGKSGPPGARIDEEVEIPPGHTGEVLSSSEWETVVIYPIHSTGELEPHLIKVESFTSDFRRATRHNPFVLDRSDYKDPGRPKRGSVSKEEIYEQFYDIATKTRYAIEYEQWEEAQELIRQYQLHLLRNGTAQTLFDEAPDEWRFLFTHYPFVRNYTKYDENALSKNKDEFLSKLDYVLIHSGKEEASLERKKNLYDSWGVGQRDDQGKLIWSSAREYDEAENEVLLTVQGMIEDALDFAVKGKKEEALNLLDQATAEIKSYKGPREAKGVPTILTTHFDAIHYYLKTDGISMFSIVKMFEHALDTIDKGISLREDYDTKLRKQKREDGPLKWRESAANTTEEEVVAYDKISKLANRLHNYWLDKLYYAKQRKQDLTKIQASVDRSIAKLRRTIDTSPIDPYLKHRWISQLDSGENINSVSYGILVESDHAAGNGVSNQGEVGAAGVIGGKPQEYADELESERRRFQIKDKWNVGERDEAGKLNWVT
jgi:hypothetical protein